MVELVLFDIDGTLLDCHPCQERAFAHVFRTVFGIEGKLTDVVYPGMLTPAIITEVCAHHGVQVMTKDPRMDDAITSLRAQVADCMAAQDAAACILPGVVQLLDALHQQDVLLGVYTGNPRVVAEVLLQSTGLDSYFGVFAYGDEAPTRRDLLRLSLQRATTLIGTPILTQHVIAIGDSVHDVQAAHAVGIISMAVATGATDQRHLQQHAPDLLLPDLRDAEPLLHRIQTDNPNRPC